ncbi:MAG: NAD(P)H-dependent oxidoreductase [Candidatus Eremiobacteraeota bacterium]|nr:NAD(P)H-dependent oxidoreductase [Candidatus Eremiobacteraeota bacterium]
MAEKSLTFAAFAGSLRKGSYNRLLLHALKGCAPADVAINILDISGIPLYNADLDTETPPTAVRRLREGIQAADGLIIVTPEHNFSVSGVTKTVIEWASRPSESSCLDGKPTAVMGGAPGGFGTVRAQMNVRQMSPESGMLMLQDPEIRVSRVHTKFDERGQLTDEELRHDLAEFLHAMAAWTRRLQPR